MARTNSLPTMRPATVSRGHRRAGGVDTGPTRVDDVSGGNRRPTGQTPVSPTTPQSGATERDRPLFGARGIARWTVRLGGRRLMSSRAGGGDDHAERRFRAQLARLTTASARA